MTEDTPGPEPDATAIADDTQEEGLISNIPPAKHTAASLLTKRSSTKKTLDKYDLDGNGDIDSDEAQLMAKDLNAANKQVVEVEKDKKKYKQVAGISFTLLVLALVANFGLTIATIYLTRQFSIEDGTLVDKSTGKQVTTKARGNFVGLTFDGSLNNDGSGRLLEESMTLEESMCHATYSMSDNEVSQTVFQFRSGTDLYYGTADGDDGDHGEVDFIAGHHEFSTFEDLFGNPDFPPITEATVNTFDPFIESHPDTMCNVYAHVVCTSGETQETCDFFMMCCGTEEEKLFTTGNCCMVPHDAGRRLNQGEWDQRRLGKCSQ